MTPEQKQAASERMKAMHAAKKAAKAEQETVHIEDALAAKQAELPPIPEKPTEKIYSQDDVDALTKQVQEVMQLLKLQQSLGVQPQVQQQSSGPQIQGGRVVGMTNRYSVDPDQYPDVRERLGDEPRLAQFAFKLNYDLDYEFQTTEYQTKDGLWQKEPRFKLELSRIKLDDDGNKTNGRYLISRAFFLEDPQSAITVARQNGFDVNEMEQKEFLDEMRYIQMRDWLLENFYASKAFDKHSNKADMVIDGKVVQYFEITSQNSEKMPFDQLGTKL